MFGNTSRKGNEESEMATIGAKILGRGAEKTYTDVWNRNGVGPILQEVGLHTSDLDVIGKLMW